MAFENDWAYLQAALGDLQEYILSNNLYWPLRLAPLPGSAKTPQLTPGNLALTLLRLSCGPLSSRQAGALADLSQRVQAVRDDWRANWERKSAKEFSSRLNLWQQYLRELRGDPRGHAAYFANEVTQRAVLHLLRAETLNVISAHEEEQLAMLDGLLRGLSQPGPFVWEESLQKAFPQPDYWFLYVRVIA